MHRRISYNYLVRLIHEATSGSACTLSAAPDRAWTARDGLSWKRARNRAMIAEAPKSPHGAKTAVRPDLTTPPATQVRATTQLTSARARAADCLRLRNVHSQHHGSAARLSSRYVMLFAVTIFSSSPPHEHYLSAQETHVEEQDVEMESTTPVQALCNFGIQSSDIKKLQAEGYHTVEAILMESKRRLARIKGFSDAKVDKVVEAALKVGLPLSNFITAKDLQLQRDTKVSPVLLETPRTKRLLMLRAITFADNACDNWLR